ncbi:MAG: B12-binding domain-containing radical SAM protein, partial [Pseudomonadota bacterium]
PRFFSRYGAPIESVTTFLKSLRPPDVIFLTSSMTYWYTGVKETADLLRELFPKAHLVLGGIYATLMPEHARENIRPDTLVIGMGEPMLHNFLAEWTKEPLPLQAPVESLRKVWKHYPVLKSYPLLTSRGCPYDCSFCASKILNPLFEQIRPQVVLEEIQYAFDERGLSNFVFYDDALFSQPTHHIKPLLHGINRWGKKLSFHTPNGLLPRFIDQELAELMATAGFVQPRLSLETTNPKRLTDISNKVTRDHYKTALHHLHTVGYSPAQIITYLIMGLPGQNTQEVRDTVDFVFDSGATCTLSSFSPIAGTKEYERTNLPMDIDPLLLNTTVFACSFSPDKINEVEELRLYVKERNHRSAHS